MNWSFSCKLLNGDEIRLPHQLFWKVVLQRWSILGILLGSFLIMLAKPYGFQNQVPFWFSVPIVAFMFLTCVLQILFYSVAYSYLRPSWLPASPPSWLLTAFTAVVEAMAMDYLMLWAVADPLMGVKEALLKISFSFIFMECWLFVFGAFGYRTALHEVLSEGDIGFAETKAAPPDPEINIGEKSIPLSHLVRLEAQNVHVCVVTFSGDFLVRARFADVVSALPAEAGVQPHRSHWVGTQSVRDFVEANGKPHLTLLDGTRIPVAKSRISEVRNWMGAGYS